ncbi:glycerol kinase [candidate division KSB1 bacterium]|nr:glycerol kinase [candidate division KSB1 bacterium]
MAKEGHDICFDHWKANRDGKLKKCEKCGRLMEKDKPLCLDCYNKGREGQATGRALTATAIGEKVALTANRVNAILVELAWITKGPGDHGWISTPQGRKNGAVDREFGTDKTPFVQWSEGILRNRAFTDAVRDFKGEKPVIPETSSGAKSDELGFREKFPATHRATDGHMVRSRGEMLIDNWLYAAQVIHAYERKVPIEEELYCDFYLPTGKVYLEFWGMENDPAYAARKRAKLELYKKNGLNLIELKDADLLKLDDVMPAKLRPFDIKVS